MYLYGSKCKQDQKKLNVNLHHHFLQLVHVCCSGVGSMGAPGAGEPTFFLSEALQESTLIVTAKYCGVCMLHNTSRLPIRHY